MDNIQEFNRSSKNENGIYLLRETDHLFEILTEFQDYLPPLKNEEYRRSAAEKLSKYACCILLRKDNEITEDFSGYGFQKLYDKHDAYAQLVCLERE